MRGRHAIGDAGVADLALRPHEPLRHGGLGHEERPRDLGCRQAHERAQRERDLRLERERRVAAGEDEAQPVVADAALVALARGIGGQHRHLLELVGSRCRPAHPVDCPVARRGREPSTGFARDAVALPPFQRQREGVLRALLGDVPVAGHPDEGGDDPSPLVAKCARDGGLHVGDYSSQIGLTSMLPFRAPGIFDATPMASSRSLQSTR